MAYRISLKRPDQETSALLIRFSKNGEPFKFYTGKTILTKYWDEEKQRMSPKAENHRLINRYLENYVYELGLIIDRYEAQKMRLSQDLINQELDQIFNKTTVEKQVKEFDFVAFYEKFIENHQHYAATTISILRQNRKHVICAMGLVSKAQLTKYNSVPNKQRSQMTLTPTKKLPFEEINKSFFEAVIRHLHTATYFKKVNGVDTELNYTKNYITKHTKRLRQIINDAIDDGHVTPFSMKKLKPKIKKWMLFLQTLMLCRLLSTWI